MPLRPKFTLSRLRQIGWSRWDPIGLRDVEDRPDDEYDSYLLQAAGRLWNGVSVQQVADYLVNVETDIMGLGAGIPSLVRERACEVASVLRDYVIELRA